MSIVNTFTTNDKTKRQFRQAELHRKCILILKARRRKT